MEACEASKDLHFRRDDSYPHIRWMLDKIDMYVDDGRVDKGMRWLGFVQGVLWGRGIYTISQMQKHNLDEFLDDCLTTTRQN